MVCFASIATIALTFYTLPSRNVALFSVNLVLVGLTVLPIIPIGFAFSVEVTFPISEALSNGMMILVSQVFGTCLGIVASMLAKINPIYTIWLYLGSCMIAAVSSLFVKEQLKRIQMQGNQEKSRDEKRSSYYKQHDINNTPSVSTSSLLTAPSPNVP